MLCCGIYILSQTHSVFSISLFPYCVYSCNFHTFLCLNQPFPLLLFIIFDVLSEKKTKKRRECSEYSFVWLSFVFFFVFLLCGCLCLPPCLPPWCKPNPILNLTLTLTLTLSCLLSSRVLFLELTSSCLAEKGMVRMMKAFLLVATGAIVQGSSVRTVA